jgi:hypothetical protein
MTAPRAKLMPHKRPDAPRVWLRIDKVHVAKVIKARRALCYGEGVRR